MNNLKTKVRKENNEDKFTFSIDADGFHYMLIGCTEEEALRQKKMVDEIISYVQYCKLNDNVVEVLDRTHTGKYTFFKVFSNHSNKSVKYNAALMEYDCSCAHGVIYKETNTKACKHIKACVKVEMYYLQFRLGEKNE